jgi:hypothetical protein
MKNVAVRTIVLIWLAWVVIIIGFQALATSRLSPQYPDRAQRWTETEVDSSSYQAGRRYLLEPFMNDQVAWDSEYYLSIAVGGYDDPYLRKVIVSGNSLQIGYDRNMSGLNTGGGGSVSMNYAFFGFYPLMIRIFSYPLSLLGMNTVATATLAGVIVSALGALMGMLALYDMTRGSLGEEGAMRAVFYLVIFPTAFFLVQVYTEGLFVGLAFGCLAMLKRRNWALAGLLGMCATLTRAVGVGLVLPMAIVWFSSGEWMDLDMEWKQIILHGIPLRPLARGLLAISPLIVFLIWKVTYGPFFDFIEEYYFGRGYLTLGQSFYAWYTSFREMFQGMFNPQQIVNTYYDYVNPQHSAYYLTEFIGFLIGAIACIACFKYDRDIAWFSVAVFLISWGSGASQGIHRYILGAPAVFYMLARWGRNPVFDRAWTIASVLIMGLLSMLFAFDFWVA